MATITAQTIRCFGCITRILIDSGLCGSKKIENRSHTALWGEAIGGTIFMIHCCIMNPGNHQAWNDPYTPLDLLYHVKLGYAYDTDRNEVLFTCHPKHIKPSKIPKKSKVSRLFYKFPLKKDVSKFSHVEQVKQ